MPSDPAPDGARPATDDESFASARVVVARVLGLTGARSVVDVGYGSGAWSQACCDLGVPEVVGVDGEAVPPGERGHATEFVEQDPAEPLDLRGRWFGLAICVRVADDLPPERAPALVAEITSFAPVVLFSAAVPGPGGASGASGVGERWPEYWVQLFEDAGWESRDAIRPWVRANDDVAWWYRQSLFLAVAPRVAAAYTSFPLLTAKLPRHPVDYVVRPAADVIVTTVPDLPVEAAPVDSPPDAVPAPPPETDVPDPGLEPPPGVEPFPGGSPDSPDASDAPEAPEAPDASDVEGAPTNATEEELSFPQPPGWAALQRVAGRARRRIGR